ncbi:MAG: hypothetical protein JJD98_19360 [Polaromonas sp.]|nr:hypothetical protein [Polaromonas sp.]
MEFILPNFQGNALRETGPAKRAETSMKARLFEVNAEKYRQKCQYF